jgi:hypothetical protein
MVRRFGQENQKQFEALTAIGTHLVGEIIEGP